MIKPLSIDMSKLVIREVISRQTEDTSHVFTITLTFHESITFQVLQKIPSSLFLVFSFELTSISSPET